MIVEIPAEMTKKNPFFAKKAWEWQTYSGTCLPFLVTIAKKPAFSSPRILLDIFDDLGIAADRYR